jgi:hypothetical protein
MKGAGFELAIVLSALLSLFDEIRSFEVREVLRDRLLRQAERLGDGIHRQRALREAH